jgi:tetratricopeptide (TPR) repeat protein
LPDEELSELITIGVTNAQENPEVYHTHRNLGAIYYRQADYSKAAEYLGHASRLDEEDVRYFVWNAMLQFQLGNKAEAAKLLQRAREQRGAHWPTWMSQIEIPMLIQEAEILIGPSADNTLRIAGELLRKEAEALIEPDQGR